MYTAIQVFSILMAVVLPVCMLLFVSSYLRNKQETKFRLDDLKKELDLNSTDDLEKEITNLKERIIVLESIVTDRNYDLDRKISNL